MREVRLNALFWEDLGPKLSKKAVTEYQGSVGPIGAHQRKEAPVAALWRGLNMRDSWLQCSRSAMPEELQRVCGPILLQQLSYHIPQS